MYPPDTYIFYDNEGNLLYDEVFLSCGAFARSFRLFDFDSNGIPTIMIGFHHPEAGIGWQILYRYINGEFVQMDSPIDVFELAFWADGDRMVWFRRDEYSGIDTGFFFVNFVGTQVIAEETGIPEDWFGLHFEMDFMINPTIFGADTALTRIPHMIALQNEITANIMARLGLRD